VSVKTALQALAIARSSEADEAVLAVYLHELADLDRGLVMLACERLAKLPRREYQAALPDVGTIREEVVRIGREKDREARMRRLAPVSPGADFRTYVHCRECHDGGWQMARCTGGTGERGLRDPDLRLVPCGRRAAHTAHSYAERCPCVDINPVIARRRERAAEKARQAAAI